MIVFNKKISSTKIVYAFSSITVTCKKNPKWDVCISDISCIDDAVLIDIINKVLSDLNTSEAICISFDNNLARASKVIPKLESQNPIIPLIYKVRENNIENIRKHKNDIMEYHLPIIINYVISSDVRDLESSLQTLKELDEFYSIDEETKRRFKGYSRSINKIYLTKQVEEGVCDSLFDRATFMYYLDRFKFKTTFEGDASLVKSWEDGIKEYYQNAYLVSKKRNLKVV